MDKRKIKIEKWKDKLLKEVLLNTNCAVDVKVCNEQFINSLDKKSIIAILKKHWYIIKIIPNPTEEMYKITIIESCGKYDLWQISNRTEEIDKFAISYFAHNIHHIKNPSEELMLLAVKKDGLAIKFIKNPTEKVQKAAIKNNLYAIQYIKNISDKTLKYFQKELKIKKEYSLIKYIKNPSEKLQLLAVDQNSENIKLINNPTEKVIIKTLCKNLELIKFVCLTENIVRKLIKNVPKIILFLSDYINNFSPELQEEIIKLEPYQVIYIKNPQDKIIQTAVAEKPQLITKIKNPTSQLVMFAIISSAYDYNLIAWAINNNNISEEMAENIFNNLQIKKVIK